MARRMSRRRKNGHAAVAEYVTIPFQLCDRVLRLEPRQIIGAGPLVFGFLHIEHGRGKHLDITDMVGMGM